MLRTVKALFSSSFHDLLLPFVLFRDFLYIRTAIPEIAYLAFHIPL